MEICKEDIRKRLYFQCKLGVIEAILDIFTVFCLSPLRCLLGKSNNEIEIKNHIQTFIDSKTPDFYSNGVHKLPIKWQEVIDNKGTYVIKK